MRPDLPPAPPAIAALPLSAAGYPVPWFVTWVDGVPDFRIVDPGRMLEAVRRDLCWVCGRSFGTRRRAYVIGPMCAVTRASGEPPAHLACADWSARACPWLTRPLAHRRTRDLPDLELHSHPGALQRNPGVAMVWATRGTRIREANRDGLIFDVGEPEAIACYAEGRPATPEEVLASIESGYPLLLELAVADGPEAIAGLEAMRAAATDLLELEAGPAPAGPRQAGQDRAPSAIATRSAGTG